MASDKITMKERREKLRERMRANAKNRDSGGGRKKNVLDFSDYPEIQFYRPVKGKNEIDIIPYIVKTKNHPGGVAPGYEDYLLDVWVHRYVGPMEVTVLCLNRTYGHPCPICEEMKSIKDQGGSKEELKGLTPSRRCFYNIIDLDHEDKGIQLWEISHFLFEKELLEEAETAEDSFVYFSDIEEGRTIQFRASEEEMTGNKFFKFKSFTFKKRDPYSETILKETLPLDEMLIIPTYDEVRNAFYGLDADGESVTKGGKKENTDDDDDDDAPKKSGKSGVSKFRRGATKSDEEEPEDDTPEEDEKPSRGRSNRGEAVTQRMARGEARGGSGKKAGKESDEDETPPTRERGKKKGQECPYGHRFGQDCDEQDDCKECEVWDACAHEQDFQNASK